MKRNTLQNTPLRNSDFVKKYQEIFTRRQCDALTVAYWMSWDSLEDEIICLKEMALPSYNLMFTVSFNQLLMYHWMCED